MMEGLPLCKLEIDFHSDGSEKFEDWVAWNKDQKTLTCISCHTWQEDGSSERSLCGAPEAFEEYKGKNLRVKLNGKQMTLSVRGDVPTYNAEGRFQIAYSECKEGWLTKEVFFEVWRLAEWVYYDEGLRGYCTDVSKDFGNRSEGLSEWLTDNKKSWFACDCFEGRSFYLIKTTDASPEEFGFKYLNEDFTLTLYDACIRGFGLPFRFSFSYERKCYFEIISSREHDKEFFETLIRKITYFLSLLFRKKAVINRIYESDKQQCRWDYNPSEKEENSPDSLLFPSISYDTIHDKFGDKLTKWFEVCERYEMIIDSFFRDRYKRSSNKDVLKDMTWEEKREEKEIMKDLFLKRLNRLEMYGNILTEGCDASKDIEAAVSAVDQENIISEIFSDYARLSPDGKSFQCRVYNFGKTPEDKKKDFVKIVTAFRNYFVHPFRDGKKKTPFTEGIEEFFTTAQIGSPANFAEATYRLSQCFSVILYFVLLQSESVKESKGRTKQSQNLFPETNRTREDYGKIILKYLRKCWDDGETSEILKGYVAHIKNILLFLREEATRRTSDGANSESRCTDVVLTENNLKCLSDILTELTYRCGNRIKEAFEKDERQKDIWALQLVFECFMHDFSGNSERLPEGLKNLGELIINLRNSFDPNVNSLFCERFTDYKNAEVNFKAFARLSDTLSDILRRLLLQEAGLTEFFGKKMNA